MGTTDKNDWPSEPVEIVDDVPFLVVRSYGLGGVPEPLANYLDYCEKKCDWNNAKFKTRSKEEKSMALAKLLSLPRLKGKLDKESRTFFEAQIK